MQHRKQSSTRHLMAATSLMLIAVLAAKPAQADSSKPMQKQVVGTSTTASGVNVPQGKLPESGKATAGGVVSKAGDNQYPGVAPVPLPKPRKDALEAGALKAKAKAAQ
jgi:hypothetical protein